MLWGAALGYLIPTALSVISEAARHEGSGVVRYENHSERVGEQQYKRHYYAEGGIVLVLGVSFWVIVARVARDTRLLAELETEKIKADLEATRAYQVAFASTLDRATLQRAADQANQSPDVLAARREAEMKGHRHWKALAKSRGD